VGSTAQHILFGFRIFRSENPRVCCKLFYTQTHWRCADTDTF